MIAFCLWAEGYAEDEKLKIMKSAPPRRYELVAGYKVERRAIPGYFTDEFWYNLRTWNLCTTHGLPYRKGWAEHPAVLMHLLQIFDAAKAKAMNANGDK